MAAAKKTAIRLQIKFVLCRHTSPALICDTQKNPAKLRNLVISHGLGLGKVLIPPSILTELEAETLRELGALFAVLKG